MSNETDNAGKPRLVVLLGDAELTPELRDALAAFPGVVRTADSKQAVWDGIAEQGELILTALDPSLLADLAREAGRAPDGSRPRCAG
jgi:hypothetical protein